VQKIHRFIFYFDNKMRVLGATSLFEWILTSAPLLMTRKTTWR
jgi:hypothetical protein